MRPSMLKRAMRTAGLQATQEHRVALLGFGTVGKGFAEIVESKKKFLAKKYNLSVNIVAVCDAYKGMVYNPNGLDVPALLKYDAEASAAGEAKNCLAGFKEGKGYFKYDWDVLKTCADVDADTVCEVTFTNLTDGQPAINYVKACLTNGKNVVTTNKGPVVFAYDELTKLAEDNGREFMIEGSIMSGTPIVSLMRVMPACNYSQISGILNGTCNYILSSMENDQVDFDVALKEAQRLGYAEADPSFDIGGGDARAKAIILMRILGDEFPVDKIELVGIEGISKDMVNQASAENKRWKLVSQLKMDDLGQVTECSVKPQKLDKVADPLAGVGGALNALNFKSDMLGPDLTMIGPGAGKIETGYSLFADMLYLCGAQNHSTLQWTSLFSP